MRICSKDVEVLRRVPREPASIRHNLRGLLAEYFPDRCKGPAHWPSTTDMRVQVGESSCANEYRLCWNNMVEVRYLR